MSASCRIYGLFCTVFLTNAPTAGFPFSRLQDPIIERIERRISLYTQLPLAHQEDIQVLRYTKGQQYGAHYDSAYNNKDAGPHHRLATFYMYLSDVEEGGETAFPEKSVWYDPAMGVAADPTFSACAKGNVAAKPKAGDAALFYSFFPNGTSESTLRPVPASTYFPSGQFDVTRMLTVAIATLLSLLNSPQPV